MSKAVHRLYVSTMSGIVLITIFLLIYKGLPYYTTSFDERFYNPDHDLFKPSGLFGHGLGIIGTFLILFGVFSYIARKRYQFLSRLGRLKYWLEFHIFLCVLGPIMILFHTAFKFGGIVSISFWSMVAVVASGVIGRFIYIQIPRTIEGKEMSLTEVQEMQSNIDEIIRDRYDLDEASYQSILDSTNVTAQNSNGSLLSRMVKRYFEDRKRLKTVRRTLIDNKIPRSGIKQVLTLIKSEISLNNKIEGLQSMQRLFRYWHIAHLPFAIIMLIIMVLHVGITVVFGARWIF